MSPYNTIPQNPGAATPAAPPRRAATVLEVSPVAPATSPLPEVGYKEAVESLLKWSLKSNRFDPRRRLDFGQTEYEETRVEACAHYHGTLVDGVECNPLVAAVHLAFADHRPLTLSPDILWLAIAQGFANHVNAEAETLRPQLVAHSGKLTIKVRRDDFVKGSPENPWPEVFDAFSQQIRGHLGPATHDLLLPRFSTTGPVQQAAAQVVLLDAMQSFFDYRLLTRCGIPRIELEGTADDWDGLAQRTGELGRFGLEWWTSALVPILREFAAAARGEVRAPFWRSLYKVADASGGPYVTGWINAFFPYFLNDKGVARRRNRWLREGGDSMQEFLFPQDDGSPRGFPEGSVATMFPHGMSKAPFEWNYLGTLFPMEFLGGFVGVRQDPHTMSLRPEIGWAVREAVPQAGGS